MSFKYFFICFSLIINIVIGKSFTVVIDTTVSMQDEIDVIKKNIVSVADVLRNTQEFEDYIIVPFNDQDVKPPVIVTNPYSLKGVFNSLIASGGNECPEDSLAGIQKALEISKHNSFVYVFTDAFAKDISKYKAIEELCRNTQSQVVIFLSGSCSVPDSGSLGYEDVFYDIAKSCSGAVFKFDSVNLRKAFNYIKEMVTTDWNEIINHEPFSGYKQLTIKIDPFTSDLIIAISGNYPNLQLFDTEEKSPEIQKIVDTKQSLVVRLVNLKPGQYQASVRCQNLTSLTFYKKSRTPYHYGFSTRLPNSLAETALRPMPGRQNYMLIVIPKDYNFKIISMEMQETDDSEKKILSIEESQIRDGFYTASVFVEPSISFRMLIHGRDASFEESTFTTKVIEPQVPVTNAIWSKPAVEILGIGNNLIDFGRNATLVCKVKAYPKPEIMWRDNDGNTLVTEELLLEVPSIYLSYVTLNATMNQTLNCEARNKEGSDEKSVNLYVNRTFSFEIIRKPENETFEYGSEAKLYCEVNAYPEVKLEWYHNGTSVEYSENTEVVADEHALVIKNMTLNDVGSYQCKVSNEVRTETFEAEVDISGLEAPELEFENTEIDLKPGDWRTIECRVTKGNPPPEITWEYQIPDGDEFEDVPSDVFVEGTQLKISAVKKEHKGTYRCRAINMMGEDAKEITVNIKYAPIISNSDEGTLRVKEEDQVVLACKVDATPEATVRWELSQGGAMMDLESRHTVDDRYTLRFTALWKDSGVYTCVAENQVGKSEKKTYVDVLVRPFIQPAESRVVTATYGSSITLPCNILYGHPTPSTKWEFIATDSTTSVLSRANTTTAPLHLKNVSQANEGLYLCIAENEIGNDRIRIEVRVN